LFTRPRDRCWALRTTGARAWSEHQSFNILPKIREVDRIMTPALQQCTSTSGLAFRLWLVILYRQKRLWLDVKKDYVC
jgi:hypothetical protein